MDDTHATSPTRARPDGLQAARERAGGEPPRIGLALVCGLEAVPGADALLAILGRGGYRVWQVRDAATCLRLAEERGPSLVVAGDGVPDLGEFCRRMRDRTAVPLVCAGGAPDEERYVAALDAGADDYLTPPHLPAATLARLRALGRRAADTVTRVPAPILRFGDIEVDLVRRLVTRGGARVRMSRTEFALLAELARSANDIRPSADLLSAVWGERTGVNRHYLHVYIARLRAKLESDPANPVHIVAEHGTGYRLWATRDFVH